MGENTGIAWCDHTFNPWWGCTKVSPACQFCYAERDAKRFGQKDLWSTAHRRFFENEKHWNEPLNWDAKAKESGKIARVFSGSMCDVFEKLPFDASYSTAIMMKEYRNKLWSLIEKTPNLEWLLLTKRPENILSMIPVQWMFKQPKNVRIGVTAENQECADMRIPVLLGSWKGKNFISVEPMLSEVDITKHRNIDWTICGGESGSTQVRATRPEWVRSLRDQCIATGVPFFFKQWGSLEFHEHEGRMLEIYVGMNKTRLLDGVEWLQCPTF